MKKTLLALALLAALPLGASAQTSSEAARSDAVMLKVQQLDVLIQIVPLSLTHEEFSPLLTAIEKVRQQQKGMYVQEAKDLAAIDPSLAKMVDDGVGKGVYPPREKQKEIAATMRAMGVRRDLYANQWVEIVFQACKTTLNEGQIKVMEKSLKPELLDPSIKVADMDSDAKVRFFVRKVLLDPVAYDLLVQMSRRKDDSATPPALSPTR